MDEIILSTGKICPRCGCQSLERYFPTEYTGFDYNYNCVALCGMNFGLSRIRKGKIKIGYNIENKQYLEKRFKFKEGLNGRSD
jgi:hypothetical protein